MQNRTDEAPTGRVMLDMALSLDGFAVGPNYELGGLHGWFLSPLGAEAGWVPCVLESAPDVDRYQPVEGPPPRPRTERGLLDRREHPPRAAWRSVMEGDEHAVR